MYSLVWSRTLTSRWTYVLQHDLGVQTDAQTAGLRHASGQLVRHQPVLVL